MNNETTTKERTLIAFVDRWGAHFGGINSFNLDLIKAFAAAFYAEVQTVCVVVDADDAAMESVANTQVRLVPLYLHEIKKFPTELEGAVWEALQRDGVQIHPQDTVWLGHDRVTGGIALAAAKKRGRLLDVGSNEGRELQISRRSARP